MPETTSPTSATDANPRQALEKRRALNGADLGHERRALNCSDSGHERRALVTGASSGIGETTARLLAASGYQVIAAARRAERLTALASEVPGIEAFPTDITDDAQVAALASHIAATGGLDVLVNDAGGAFGLDPVATADISKWQRMYDINVLGTLRVTEAMLPLLRANAAKTGGSDIVFVTSTAALAPYEGGAGYTSAKHAERVLATTLRWELAGEPIRIIQIEPGAVHTDEFALVRFDGDAARAAQVYDGFDPLLAGDIAEAITWALSLPARVNIDHLTIRPRAQVSNWKTARSDGQIRQGPSGGTK